MFIFLKLYIPKGPKNIKKVIVSVSDKFRTWTGQRHFYWINMTKDNVCQRQISLPFFTVKCLTEEQEKMFLKTASLKVYCMHGCFACLTDKLFQLSLVANDERRNNFPHTFSNDDRLLFSSFSIFVSSWRLTSYSFGLLCSSLFPT